MNSYTKDQLNLHFIVFIWGFTAILGKFITIDALGIGLQLHSSHFGSHWNIPPCVKERL